MRPAVIITSAVDLAVVLRGDREALGLTGEALDDRLGWQERYTAKAENVTKRWGRATFRMGDLCDTWLLGLNRALVLVDRDVAEQLIRTESSPSPGVARRLVARMSIG